jgi:hypothetical protein
MQGYKNVLSIMDKKFPKTLRLIFLVHALIAIIVGIQHMIFPNLPGILTGVTLPAPVLYRILGAAVFSFGVSSWMAYKEKTWVAIRIIVIMEIIWSVLGAVIIAWGILSGKLPWIEWPNAVLLLIFGSLFMFFWLKRR